VTQPVCALFLGCESVIEREPTRCGGPAPLSASCSASGGPGTRRSETTSGSVFTRTALPRQSVSLPRYAAEQLSPALEALVARIVQAVGSADDRLWWVQCVRRLGLGSVDRALGQLKEASQLGKVNNRGGLLTKIFKGIAHETGIALQ